MIFIGLFLHFNMGPKKERFNKILRDIKSIRIQGARNVAQEAVKAYFLIPSKSSKKKLLNSRPTEPMMKKVLDLAESGHSKKELLSHFDSSQDKINQAVLKLIKKGDRIFTHCHSSSVSNALIYAKKKGKKFFPFQVG